MLFKNPHLLCANFSGPFFYCHTYFFNILIMRYDKDGLPVKEYYTEELTKSPKDKMKAIEYQKYYTGGAIILMFVVLICMHLVLN